MPLLDKVVTVEIVTISLVIVYIICKEEEADNRQKNQFNPYYLINQ